LKQWVHDTPQYHFDCHFDRYSTMPTMFISTTPELLRALRIAVEHRFNGNQNIKIIVIDVKKTTDSHHDITNAGSIARQLKRPDAALLKSDGCSWDGFELAPLFTRLISTKSCTGA